jgi:hypothetical protein
MLPLLYARGFSEELVYDPEIFVHELFNINDGTSNAGMIAAIVCSIVGAILIAVILALIISPRVRAKFLPYSLRKSVDSHPSRITEDGVSLRQTDAEAPKGKLWTVGHSRNGKLSNT